MKVDFKLLGLFSIKSEDMKFWQLLLLILLGGIIMLVAIYWLKVYALPAFGVQGVISLIQNLKNRSP